jgi:hypothetical protein
MCILPLRTTFGDRLGGESGISRCPCLKYILVLAEMSRLPAGRTASLDACSGASGLTLT